MPDLPDAKIHAHPHKDVGKNPRRKGRQTTSSYHHVTTSAYAELAVTSNFTFLTGASHPDEYVYRAAELGYEAIAITDRNSLAGIVRAHVAAKDAGIPFVVGCRLEFAPSFDSAPEGPRNVATDEAQRHPGTPHNPRHLAAPAGAEDATSRSHTCDRNHFSVLVYPTSRAAYGRLCRLLTLGKRRAQKGHCLLTLDDLLECHEGLLAVILPSDDWFSHIAKLPDNQMTKSLDRLRAAFDDDRLSLALTRLYGPDDANHKRMIESLSVEFDIPLVAVNDVYYHHPSRRALQDVMTCVRHHCTLAEAGFRLFPNGERYLKDPCEMARLFAAHPEAIERTMEIAERALGLSKGNEATRQRGKKAMTKLPNDQITKSGFSLDQLRYEYPHETCPFGKTPMEHLIDLTWQGAAQRYPLGVPEKVRKQIEHEFALIEELNYAPYFLTVHDLVGYARSRGILCQGRGAAANSAVCYCLGVTAVDPDRINLLFERFVSRERNEPPDIDIDFEHERREEVIQYIYEKYGRDRAGLTAEVITYRRRSAVRDVGKALGLSLDAVDRIAKRVDHWELNPFADSEEGDVPAQLAALGFDPADATVRHLIRLVGEISGFPRHLSQHVGGFVMAEGLLCESVPIENAAMKNRTVIEWDKDDIEALGMLKVDVLGLGMLTCISKALAMINSHEATKPRSHEGVDRYDKETKVGRHEDAEALKDKRRLDNVQHNKNISRLDCMAESHATCEAGVPGNFPDAGQREIRTDRTDAAGGSVHSFEHCGRTRPPEPARLCSISQDCPGLADGVAGSTSSIRRPRVPSHPSGVERTASGNGPSPSGADPKPGKSPVALSSRLVSNSSLLALASANESSSPPWLCGSVAPWLTLTSIPAEDPTVYDMMCKADTVGVFQIESRAQMTMLPRLRPRCFYDLVIEVAIVRPGPIIGDMVHPYLRRRSGEEKFSYPTPVIEEVLGKTLGVPLFQEQVMALAIKAAGFTAGEAERLRRAITAWTSKDDIARYPARFIEGMIRNGYEPQFATWCFERMKGFSQYGFPESHAASFALLVYASAWIKCYHPAAFAAALLNSQPMGFYAPAQIIRDAQEHGVTVLATDVNFSEWDCTLEEATKGEATRHHGNYQITRWSNDQISHEGPSLRLGLRLLWGLREADAKRMVETVRAHGPFATPFELWQASGVAASTFHCLALGDAFQSMGLDRQHALWEVQQLHGKPLPLFDRSDPWSSDRADSPNPPTPNEFEAPHGQKSVAHRQIPKSPDYQTTQSSHHLPEIPYSHQIAADYRNIGFSLKDHPLSFLRELLAERGVRTAAEAKDEGKSPFGRRIAVAGIVLFRQRPGTARGVMFMTIEDETGRVDLIVRPGVYEKFRDAAVYSRLVLARGRVERQNGVVHVLARAFESLDHLAAGLPSQSRDFR